MPWIWSRYAWTWSHRLCHFGVFSDGILLANIGVRYKPEISVAQSSNGIHDINHFPFCVYLQIDTSSRYLPKWPPWIRMDKKATLSIIVLGRSLSTLSSDSQSLPPSSSFYSGTPPMRPSPPLPSLDRLFSSWEVPAASRREFLCREPAFVCSLPEWHWFVLGRERLRGLAWGGVVLAKMEIWTNDLFRMAIASASLGPRREVEVLSDFANGLVRWFAKCSCQCYGLLVFAGFKIFRSEFSWSDEVLFLCSIVSKPREPF